MRKSPGTASPFQVAHGAQHAARVETVVGGSFVSEIRRVFWLHDPVAREQCIQCLAAHRHEHGHGPTAVSHFDGFPARNERQVATDMLPQLPDADAVYVLHRSTSSPAVARAGKLAATALKTMSEWSYALLQESERQPHDAIADGALLGQHRRRRR